MREVILHDVKSFNDLFEIAERDAKKSPLPFVRRDEPEKPGGRKPTMKIGPYLCFQSCIEGEAFRDALYVKPTKLCLNAVLKHMIFVDRDMTHFKVCVYDNGSALVTCSFGLILGEVWLAKVDLATVPDTREPVPGESGETTDPRAGKAKDVGQLRAAGVLKGGG